MLCGYVGITSGNSSVSVDKQGKRNLISHSYLAFLVHANDVLCAAEAAQPVFEFYYHSIRSLWCTLLVERMCGVLRKG